MNDFPEMLRGAIAIEHEDAIRTAWQAEERKAEGKNYPERSDSVQPCDSCPPCGATVGGITCGRACTGDTCGNTCDETCATCDPICAPKKAFQPAVAGWSAPPPLPPV